MKTGLERFRQQQEIAAARCTVRMSQAAAEQQQRQDALPVCGQPASGPNVPMLPAQERLLAAQEQYEVLKDRNQTELVRLNLQRAVDFRQALSRFAQVRAAHVDLRPSSCACHRAPAAFLSYDCTGSMIGIYLY